MEPEKFIEFLMSRRSIRRYKKDPVPVDLLLKLVEVARFAPSARNSQPWEFVLVVDQDVKRRLVSIYPWRQPLSEAPAGIVVLCDETKSPQFFMYDCANAVMYLMLAAHAYGLGTVWIGVGEKEKRMVQEIVHAPPNKIPIAIVAVGWPDEKPSPRPRKPVEEITHVNSYGVRP